MPGGIEILALATHLAVVESRDRQALGGIDGFDHPTAVRRGDAGAPVLICSSLALRIRSAPGMVSGMCSRRSTPDTEIT